MIFLGPPGAGKGTQADRLKSAFGLTHLSTGDMLRQAIADGTTLGREAKVFMDAGDLVPDHVMIGMIRERLEGGAANFLLDGFPRTLAQAEALDTMLTDVGAPLDAVLSIAVSRDELVRRLAGRWLCRKCGRSYHEVFSPYDPAQPCPAGGHCDLYQRDDDRADAVANRLNVYDRQTAPLIDYYRGHGLLREVDGEGEQDQVYEQIATLVAAIG